MAKKPVFWEIRARVVEKWIFDACNTPIFGGHCIDIFGSRSRKKYLGGQTGTPLREKIGQNMVKNRLFLKVNFRPQKHVKCCFCAKNRVLRP